MIRRDPDAGYRIERDLHAARTGERLTYRVALPYADNCRNCDGGIATHVRQSGILFCSEAMLRERYGR